MFNLNPALSVKAYGWAVEYLDKIFLEGKELYLYFEKEKGAPLGGLEPPTFRLTAERASQLRHRGLDQGIWFTM